MSFIEKSSCVSCWQFFSHCCCTYLIAKVKVRDKWGTNQAKMILTGCPKLGLSNFPPNWLFVTVGKMRYVKKRMSTMSLSAWISGKIAEICKLFFAGNREKQSEFTQGNPLIGYGLVRITDSVEINICQLMYSNLLQKRLRKRDDAKHFKRRHWVEYRMCYSVTVSCITFSVTSGTLLASLRP